MSNTRQATEGCQSDQNANGDGESLGLLTTATISLDEPPCDAARSVQYYAALAATRIDDEAYSIQPYSTPPPDNWCASPKIDSTTFLPASPLHTSEITSSIDANANDSHLFGSHSAPFSPLSLSGSASGSFPPPPPERKHSQSRSELQSFSTAGNIFVLPQTIATVDELEFVMVGDSKAVKEQLTAEMPPATLIQEKLPHAQTGKPAAMDLGRSAHTVLPTMCLQLPCNLLYYPGKPDGEMLNALHHLNADENCVASYIITGVITYDGDEPFILNPEIYYADRRTHKCTLIPNLTSTQFDSLLLHFGLVINQLAQQSEKDKFLIVSSRLKSHQLQTINRITGHMHDIGYFKQTPVGSVKAPLEAVNSTAYQLLVTDLFPTCLAVKSFGVVAETAEQEAHDNYDARNAQYTGVFSAKLDGFESVRDRNAKGQWLDPNELTINSLKQMVKVRSDAELQRINDIRKQLEAYCSTLDRSSSYRVTNLLRSTLWYDPNYAVNFSPKIREFIQLINTCVEGIKFGQIEDFIRVLSNRLKHISTDANKVKHADEIPVLKSIIHELNIVLLEEQVFYRKLLNPIIKELRANWVNLDEEIAKGPESKYSAGFTLSDGLKIKVTVSLQDIKSFKTQCDLAKALWARLVMEDPDPHAKNQSPEGPFIDGDLACYPTFKSILDPEGRLDVNAFAFTLNDIFNFPELNDAKVRYWVTQSGIIYQTADAIVTTTTNHDITQNFYSASDAAYFSSLKDLPVFNFQKYFQNIVTALMTPKMYTACARLHMSQDWKMKGADGKYLPLIKDDSSSQVAITMASSSTDVLPSSQSLDAIASATVDENGRQDVRSQWINARVARTNELKRLLPDMPHLINMLTHHADFIRGMLIEHYEGFLNIIRMNYNAASFRIIEEGVKIEDVLTSFDELVMTLVPKPQQEVVKPLASRSEASMPFHKSASLSLTLFKQSAPGEVASSEPTTLRTQSMVDLSTQIPKPGDRG